MQKLLTVLLLFLCQIAFPQRGFLYVKKHGFKRVKSFEEGNPIKFETKTQAIVYGELVRVEQDSININGNQFAVSDIKTIFLREKQHSTFDSKIFWLTTAGVILATAGMTLAHWTSFGKALGYAAAIGYGNYLIRYFPNLRRKRYNIGKKFSLQTLDLHF